MTLDLTDDLIDLLDGAQARAHLTPGTCGHSRHRLPCLHRDADVLVATEQPGTGRARHRRAVHRLDLRASRTPLLARWQRQPLRVVSPRDRRTAHADPPCAAPNGPRADAADARTVRACR